MSNSQIKFQIQNFKNIYHLLNAVFWTYWCGYPAKKLYVIGVTGTDGKTTTCTLIYEILKAAGIKVGLLTTVAAKISNEEIETGLHTTNPDPSLLQPILKKAVERGITHMVLEVTSHGLDQNRVWGCNFQIGVLTNITHEHLDYHKTFEKYREAKAKLLLYTHYSIINRDDPSFEWFKTRCKGKVIPYGKTQLKNVSPVLAGNYNKYNIAAAEAVAKILGIQRVVPFVVRSFSGVPGRREEVKAGQDFKVYVDFAHTPNALEVVLTQLKKELPKGGKLIAVSGATGERDKEKRPMMGEIAVRLADVMIITSDDTRSEDQDEIAAQIMSGIPKTQMTNDKIFKENDRRKAIGMAIKMAKEGDIILLAGKGHEKTILLGKTEYPWSDAEVAREVLEKSLNNE